MSEAKEKGGISVETSHIFPVIKRWLYSDKEIFLREIVSNASDAVTKLKRLSSLGKTETHDDYKVRVTIDKENATITVSDNGIGMTEDEVRKYICQIALSGALDFIEKYDADEKGSNGNDGIIGHFGLGFYSAFMVADTVDVITKSYDGSAAVKWVCTSDGDYEISDAERAERGTDVVMHITDDEKEFLDDGKAKGILKKYCSFLPVPVFFGMAGDDKEPEQINDTEPLWQKNAGDCTDEDYKNFYNKVFGDYRETLFHIHLNADYPLNFKGILYFPKLNKNYESLEGQVKLYYNQVFVADNIKEVIPEYMLMLKGVLDCPELPLNVSRSYLQNNTYVAKLSAHIVKKVADKMNSLFTTDRENFEKMWDDLKVFFEYASLRDGKFHERVKDSALFKTTNGKYLTLSEYLEAAKSTNENTVYYCNDPKTQAQYVSLLENSGICVIVLDHVLDTQYISLLEKDDVKFLRVDADVAGALKGDGAETKNEALEAAFKKVCGDKTEIKFEALKDAGVPAILTAAEEERRMNDMMKMYGMATDEGGKMTLIVNSASDLIKSLEGKDDDTVSAAAKQIYDLALLSQRGLSAKELTEFLKQSYEMIARGI